LIRRAVFLAFVVLAVVYNVEGLAATSRQVLDPITASLIVHALLFLLFFFPSLALFVKRFHDRDQKTNVLYWFYGLFLTFLFLIGDFPRLDEWSSELDDSAGLSFLLAVFVYLAVTVVGLKILLICGFLKGIDGPNQYGPDPLVG